MAAGLGLFVELVIVHTPAPFVAADACQDQSTDIIGTAIPPVGWNNIVILKLVVLETLL